MLAITNPAKQELKKILFGRVAHPLACIRLIRREQPDNYGLTIDIEIPGDEVVKYDGAKVLIVDHELSKELDGDILDIENAAECNKFVVIEKK